MHAHGALAALCLAAAGPGCALGTGDGTTADDAPAREEPLEVTVDSLDVVHGMLRIHATMTDGAADVAIRLGGDCAPRDVGGGMSTLSTFVWALPPADLADAIHCGLVARARVRDGAGFVTRVAELPVAIDVASESTEGMPQLQTIDASGSGVSLAFGAGSLGGGSARLVTPGSVIEAAAATGAVTADDDGGAETLRFVMPRLDFARAVVLQRPFWLGGASFPALLAVGGTALESAGDEPPVVGESPEGEDEGEDDVQMFSP